MVTTMTAAAAAMASTAAVAARLAESVLALAIVTVTVLALGAPVAVLLACGGKKNQGKKTCIQTDRQIPESFRKKDRNLLSFGVRDRAKGVTDPHR